MFGNLWRWCKIVWNEKEELSVPKIVDSLRCNLLSFLPYLLTGSSGLGSIKVGDLNAEDPGCDDYDDKDVDDVRMNIVDDSGYKYNDNDVGVIFLYSSCCF